jgi:hypothetical protein
MGKPTVLRPSIVYPFRTILQARCNIIAPMKNDIQSLKEILRIPEVWDRFGLPGQPSISCSSPFRPDKSPSFSVYDEGRKWKDHGTDDGGDVIDFLARAGDTSTTEATKRFIEMAGGAAVPFLPRKGPSDAAAMREAYKEGVAAEKARKRALWPSFIAEEAYKAEARKRGAESRNVSPDAFEIGELMETIHYGNVCGFPCWILTDDAGLIAEARRIDRGVFPEIGELPSRKAHTLPGSIKAWPAGTAALRRLPNISRVMMVEGSPDYVAALHFASAHIDACGGSLNTLPVAMLGRGVGTEIHPEALALLAGKRIRIYPHNDPDGGGMERARVWAAQLHAAGCVVDFFNFDGLTRTEGQPVNDLNDLCDLIPSQQNLITDLLP